MSENISGNNSLLDRTTLTIIVIATFIFFFSFLLVVKFIPVDYTKTNFYPSVGASLMIASSFITTTLTILAYLRRFFNDLSAKSTNETLWKQKVDERLDRFERRLHWSDVGFEVLIEYMRALIEGSNLAPDKKDEYDAKITKLLMSRLPMDNPAYLKGSELKRYFEEWLDGESGPE